MAGDKLIATGDYIEYSWDRRNRLVAVTFLDADGAGVVESPDVATRYLRGPAADQVLAQEDVAGGSGSAADADWLLTDHLGNTRDEFRQSQSACATLGNRPSKLD